MANKPNRPADLTLVQGGVWERAIFDVPASVPDERVQFHADKYQRKFGDYLEEVGFTVLFMGEAELDARPIPRKPDRRHYTIQAWVKRRPVVAHMEVPDEAVSLLLAKGMTLAD